MTNIDTPRYLPVMPKRKSKAKRASKRYGAAELFGRAIISLTQEEINRLSTANHKDMPCPYKAGGAACHKKGGVCSLGLYERTKDQSVSMIDGPVTTCPCRFLEGNLVFDWVREVLLGAAETKVVKEVSFLMSDRGQTVGRDEVGRIDNVLVNDENDVLKWCALEMQAVYFSGGKMAGDFKVMRTWAGPGLPFPSKHRRPDFRSSGPKRLMPQLQIKVPTLRRWGKKMAVVVDKAFWESLGSMQRTPHISNADIVWFVATYEVSANGCYRLKPHEAIYTTLEEAVSGLTGGTPVSLERFEDAIREKLERGEAR